MNYDQLSKTDCIAIIRQQSYQIDQLKFQLEQLQRALFGSKSERFVSNEQGCSQLDIFTNEVITSEPLQITEVAAHQKKKKQPKRKKLPEHLERKTEVVEPDVDTAEMRCIGEQITEKLEVIPARLFVRVIARPKYIDQQQKIHIAQMPSEPFPKGIAGATLGAKIAVDKYVDHLPLYRQSQIYKRQDIDLPRSTLNNIIGKGYQLLTPLYKSLEDKINRANYVQADESSILVLDKNSSNGSVKGCMLVKAAPNENLVLMEYIKTKEKVKIINALKDIQGHIQVDGNTSYVDLGKLNKITLMHCMAHARRYFEKALDYNKEKATTALETIKLLYTIEREIKNLPAQEKQTQRKAKSVPILNNFKKWLEEHLALKDPPNPIQKAIRYFLKRWDGLIEYTNDGNLGIDNNLIERQIRPLALGRKNYLFAGAHIGADYAAMYYSFFATCRLNNIEPLKWLTYVFEHIQEYPINKISELLPVNGFQFK